MPTSHISTSQGWALYTKAPAALAVPDGTSHGRRNNLTTLNLLLPCCKCMSLRGCFCLRLLWQEDHVLSFICCTSTIHLHAHPQGKHSTHCANRTDPCRKAPAFSVPSDGAYRAYTLRRRWTWLIYTVGAGTRHTTVKKAPGAFHSLLRFHCVHWSKQVRLPRRRRWHAIKCLISGRKAQTTKDVLSACLATKCHCYRHKLGET